VGEDSIKFLHLSDSHFGAHYALKPKNLHRRAYGELFFQKVSKLIRKAISEHKIDFIIHSGDFFNQSKPPSEVINYGVKSIEPAIREEIPIYILPGNHERSKLPLGLLPFSNGNFNLFRKPSSFIFEKNGIKIKITGFPYIRKKIKYKFKLLVKKAWFNCNRKQVKPDYSILVIHQLIEGSCIENYTFHKGNHNVLPFQQIPRKFNYVACGHIHRFQFLYNNRANSSRSTNKSFSIRQNCRKHTWQFWDKHDLRSSSFRDPLIAYAGSIERVSFAERNEPKGYIIGQVQFSPPNHKIQTVKFQFHELNAIRMVYLVWDLYKANMDDYINQTLDKLYRIHSEILSSRNERDRFLVAILKIKIKGNGSYSSDKIRYLKQEAEHLDIYLTFSYSST